jgi:CRISPR-associated protein Cmr6
MGFPFLPATGLKGLAREVAERTLAPTRVRHLFGDQSGRGAARFLDALPVPGDGPYVELDVMNPHVPGYYQGRDWPREWMDPIPLVFLAVPRGVRFRFLVAAGEASDAREAMDLLVQGLTTWGAAAKRAAGYGWMEPVDDG